MRVMVLGAAGRSGAAVVSEAASRRHEVVAVARNPDAIIRLAGVTPVRGDVLASQSWAPEARGCAAVVFALGSGSGRAPTAIYSEGVRRAMAAMASEGVRKIVAISAVPVRSASLPRQARREITDRLLYRFFGGTYADMKRMEDELAASDVDWTVVRPPRLTNAQGRGKYRWAVGETLQHAAQISRADLAVALIDATQRDEWSRAIVTVAQ